MTPDAIKLFFDTNTVLIMFLWGILCKYVPFLAKVPNWTIGWVNLLGYILTAFIVPTAHAAGVKDAVPDAVGILIGGATSAGWAMVLYETLGRTLLEKILRLKKAVPK